MQLEQIKAEIDQMEGGQKRIAREIVQFLSVGGIVGDQYRDHLDAATSFSDLTERIYADRSLVCEYTWMSIAEAYHKDEWLDSLKHAAPVQVLDTHDTHEVRFREMNTGNVALLPVPDEYDTVRLHVLEDGDINDTNLALQGVMKTTFEVGGLTLEGPFSVSLKEDNVVVALWRFDSNGRRRGSNRRGASC